MTTAEPRLVLHAGMPKTGSSALQVAFVRNEGVLEELDVHYPVSDFHRKAAKGKVTTGNAGELARFLRQEPSEPLNGILDLVFEGTSRKTVLLSSEMLYFTAPEPLATLKHHAEQRGYKVEAALFVRDFVPWVCSSYAQRVQRSGYAGDLGEFIDRHRAHISNVANRFSQFADVLGAENLNVMHYETHRYHLVEFFFQVVLGLSDNVTPLRIPEFVNRTLGSQELAWMRIVNQQADSQQRAALIGNAMMDRPLVGDETLRPTTEEVARIRELATTQAETLNRTFFNGNSVVSVGGPAPEAERGLAAEISERELHLLGICADLTRRLPSPLGADSEKAKLRAQLVRERRLRRAAQRNLKRLRSTPDFSAQKNTSVRAAGQSIKAFLATRRFGRNREARRTTGR
jgi:hypothetical protein